MLTLLAQLSAHEREALRERGIELSDPLFWGTGLLIIAAILVFGLLADSGRKQ